MSQRCPISGVKAAWYEYLYDLSCKDLTNPQTDGEILHAINSPYFSPTFKVLLAITRPTFEDVPLGEPNLFKLNRYPGHLTDVISDLSDVAIHHALRLRAAAILHHDAFEHGRQIRAELIQLSRLIYDQNNLEDGSSSFMQVLQCHLDKMDAAFSEPLFAQSIPELQTSIESDLLAITLEGLPSHRYTSDVLRKATLLPARGFSDLPTETVWKIMEYLRPTYVSLDLLSASSYCSKYSAFTQLLLVSKSWSEMILPVLYHTIALFANPEALNKLVHALKLYGPLVRTVIIDDVGLGPIPDIHIRTCQRYIDKCLDLCTSLDRVECYGDYQLRDHGSSESRALSRVRTLRLGMPPWLPYDISATISLAFASLQRLEIFGWESHPHQPSLNTNSSLGLPQLTALELRNGSIYEDQVTALLAMATCDSASSLRSLAILDMASFDASAVLALLKVNEACAHLTALHIRLANSIELATGNELPLRVLALCPALVEFSYTSPTSVDIFDHLPHTLRALELAVLVPHAHCSMLPTSAPSVSSVEPFIRYVSSDRGANLRRLSIVRRICQDGGIPSPHAWKRLETQSWDEHRRLQDFCRRRDIALDCALALI